MSDDIQRHRRALIAQAVRDCGAKWVYLAMGFDDLIEFHQWCNTVDVIDGYDIALLGNAGDLDEGER